MRKYKKYKDDRPKANPSIRDSFVDLPDVLTPKQDKAWKNIAKMLKYILKEKEHAGII